MENEVKMTIFGNLPRKSNSRQLIWNKRTGKPMIIKSQNALNYEKDFNIQIMLKNKNKFKKDDRLILEAQIFYQSYRSDLSDELLCDLLEKYEVIHNDRQIFTKRLWKFKDSENPRVEVIIKKE